jgi:SAM-dependent methyltransferase
MILIAGERLWTPTLNITSRTLLHLRFAPGLEAISPDGLSVEVMFRGLAASGHEHIASFELRSFLRDSPWREVSVHLGWLAGRSGALSVACGPGPMGDPAADWLAIAELGVAVEEDLPLRLARADTQRRTRNELHAAPGDDEDFVAQLRSASERLARWQTDGKVAQSPTAEMQWQGLLGGPLGRGDAELALAGADPLPSDTAYDYAIRLLCNSTEIRYPDYAQRLQARLAAVSGRGRPLRVLSLCCGTGRMEAELAQTTGAAAHWTLQDMNPLLLERALRRFSEEVPVRPWVGDANQLKAGGARWDVILCASALHHLVELEQVAAFVADSLEDDGEFWSVGEAVGRNGNRLWPEARGIVDALFAALPAQYRINAYTGRADATLPDRDFSVGTFEGIRSEEVLHLLSRWLEPTELQVWNCFLWRMLDAAYVRNYDLSLAADRALIQDMVRAEISHYRSGGRGTELYGFYRRRRH